MSMMTYALNILDLIFTANAVKHGAWELNPLMRWLMGLHPWAFPFAKTVLVGALCWVLDYLAKRNRVAWIGKLVCCCTYVVLTIWHIVNIAARWVV